MRLRPLPLRPSPNRLRSSLRTLGVGALGALALGWGALSAPASAADSSGVVTAPAPQVDFSPELFGHSGALKAALADPGARFDGLRGLEALGATAGSAVRWQALRATHDAVAGVTVPSDPGVWNVAIGPEGEAARLEKLAIITAVQHDGSAPVLNGYRIGIYPAYQAKRTGRFAPPTRFIEVTRENRDLHVSEHFQLQDFLTKNQPNVWPKYLALDLKLIDKLELVLQELQAMGIAATDLKVLSGYRTPHYNGPGGNGRSKYSRHTYGDAADVFVDEDGNGRMDDLNGDGKLDAGDSDVILRAVNRVERRHPELKGGAGIYRPRSHHGGFIHIDAGGRATRWAYR